MPGVGKVQEVFMLRIITCLVGVVLAFHSHAAESAQQVETIVVSGTRFETSTAMLPSAISVITAEDISLSGASHLVDVLRSSGALQISDLFGDGTDASVGLRGFSSTAQQNTLIMIDGRRLNNADNSLPDLNSVALSNIERIEIVKGSLGTLYGDKAVGGVINIITRRPEALAITVQADYGSYANRTLSASVENRHANGVGYRLSAQRQLSDNYRENNQLHLTDMSSLLSYGYATGQVFVEYQGIAERLGLPGPLFADQLALDRRQALNPDDSIGTDTRAARFGIQQTIMDGLELLAEYTNRHSDTDGQLSSGGNPALFISSRRHQELTPRLVAVLPWQHGDALLTTGVDLFETEYRIASDFGITDNTQTQYGFYGRAVLPLTMQLAATAGARYGKVENAIFVDTLAFGRSLPEGTRLDDKASAWELGLSWQLDPAWRLFGKLDRNYRFVSADEFSAVADNNFFADLFAFGTIVPLPETQTGLSHEIGVEWQGQGRSFSAQWYQLDIDNEIEFEPVLFLNTNIGATRRRGVILEGRYALSDRFTLSATYNYIDAQLREGELKGTALTFIADHSGSVRAHYRLDDHWGGYIEGLAVSDRVLGGDFTNTFAALPGHVIGNVAISYQHDQFSMSLRVNNLLNKQYSDAGNIGFDFRQPFPSPQRETYFPMPGRNLMLSVQYNYR